METTETTLALASHEECLQRVKAALDRAAGAGSPEARQEHIQIASMWQQLADEIRQRTRRP